MIGSSIARTVTLSGICWTFVLVVGGLGLTACVHHHHPDHDRVVIMDEHNYRHEGWRDEHGGWHGGWYDRDRHFHEDPNDWHH